MSTQSLQRWGGIAAITAAVVFAVAGIAVATQPFESALPPLSYFVGLILAVPAVTAFYVVQAQQAGRTGLASYILSVVGAILYSAPNYALLAGTQGISAWHDIWAFAMGNVLPLGATAFLLGLICLGIATTRTRIFPRWGGILLAAGAFLWLIAFWTGMTAALTVGTVAISISLSMIGSTLVFRQVTSAASVHLNPAVN